MLSLPGNVIGHVVRECIDNREPQPLSNAFDVYPDRHPAPEFFPENDHA